MKKTIELTCLFFLVALLGLSCVAMMEDDLEFRCDDDGDCPSGLVCVGVDYEDICKPEGWCNDTSDCAFGEVCVESENECVVEPEDWCEGNSDCDGVQVCNMNTNQCIDPSPCPGYTGSDDCCDIADPCEYADDGWCDCDNTCSWDQADCS